MAEPDPHFVADTLRMRAEMALAKVQRHEAVQRLLSHPVIAPARDIVADPVMCAALVGAFLALMFFIFYPTGKKSRRAGVPKAILVGPTDAGKTSIFSKDEAPATHTSTVPSTASVALHASGRTKTVRLVDMAGHARLRDEVSAAVVDTDAVVFVVDVMGVVRNAASVAEQLPPLLTSMAGTASRRGFNAAPLRLFILAHKADALSRETSTLSPPDLAPQIRQTAEERVRSVLTREMDRLKSARSASGGRIEGMGRVATQRGWWARLFGAPEPVAENTEDEEALVWGGLGAWNWDDIEGVDVEWGVTGLGGSKSLTGECEQGDGLQDLTDFLWDL
ncbi:hypothetical protein CspeluHIS016_0407180 [Cutaneotrichosporon spelunceum]|uniref:Signal recognition particle receptor subunit beta n=1 Tax=Cutaneotrichosporon spelunceum TaxID=1672016 RepID=A0AAD3TW04_9TREE|nr:hypothetical protein CspeluHIS016_0407180 [Cutaneotrichosporon spelunceum]